MGRGPLFHSDYKPVFSGHETFPLRYGWLKKAYDAIAADNRSAGNKKVFRDDDAIARFGVGKNMVSSMRHWALSIGVIQDNPVFVDSMETTEVGDFLFGPDGVDPYLENPASLWFIHWLLCNGLQPHFKTTWFWMFSHFSGSQFTREELVQGLTRLIETCGWSTVSATTLKRDVECFVRTYEFNPSQKGTMEDVLESPLAELRLLQGMKGTYHLVRGPKPSLSSGVFTVALDAFWKSHGSSRTLSFEMIAHEPASPGRVFLLDEIDLSERLLLLEDMTRGVYKWSETAGLKQVIRTRDLTDEERWSLLKTDYQGVNELREVAQ